MTLLKTFRARLTFWTAASILGVLLLSGAAVYVSVRTTLEEKRDEALLEITRTELEGSATSESIDPTELSVADESLLVWERATGKIEMERGQVALRFAMRSVERTEFTSLKINGQDYRALYYPDEGKIALCAQASATLQSALQSIALRLLGIGVLGAVGACLLAWHLAARLTQPLQKIAQQTASIHIAELGQRLAHHSTDTELMVVTEGLNTMLTRLESAFIAQGRFVADAAHELRSPLANLRTTAEVALRRRNPATSERALQITITEIERLTRLTESLLTLSLADAGTLVQERAEVNLSHVAAEAVQALRARTDAAGIQLVLKCSPEPTMQYGDALRLRQVFDNLLDNAVQHTSEGGKIEVTVERTQDEAIYVSVRDSGPGITEADLPCVFERLWRTDTARARATGGFGLGLSITKAIVQAHGGTIEVTNLSPNGAHFHIQF